MNFAVLHLDTLDMSEFPNREDRERYLAAMRQAGIPHLLLERRDRRGRVVWHPVQTCYMDAKA